MPIPVEVLAALNTTPEALAKNLIDDTRSVYSTMLGLDLMHLPWKLTPWSISRIVFLPWLVWPAPITD